MSSASLVSGGKVMDSITRTLAAVIYTLFRPFWVVFILLWVVFILLWGGERGKAD